METYLVSYIWSFDVVFSGTRTVMIYNAKTGMSFAGAQTSHSWTVEGQTLTSTRVKFNMQAGVPYYISVDGLYYSNIFQKAECGYLLYTKNSCSNISHDWDNDTDEIAVSLYEAIMLEPEYAEESISVINEFGETKKTTSQKARHKIKFVGGMGLVNLLNGAKFNDTNLLGTEPIKNIEIETEESEGGEYATFIMSYEFTNQLNEGTTCCEAINIDTIISPETTSGTCANYTVDVTESSNTLSVTLNNAPTGIASYKWYLNGVYFSGASSVSVGEAGDYRVDVKIGTCKASGFYYILDGCASFSLDLYKVGNEINGDLNNLPDGETATYDIKLNGSTVGSSLPYTATIDGTYYVYVTTESCNTSNGIYVKLTTENCSFTVDINEAGNTLEAITDAISPTYLWEYETKDGRTTIGTSAIVTMQGKGIYWLNLTNNGSCTKETYLYKEPVSDNVVCVLAKSTGYQFDVYEIDLGSIVNPAFELEVFVNGVRQVYTSTAPSGTNQYSISTVNKLIFNQALPLSNATIVIKKV
ncbi:MAG: hypothetical protein ACK528_14100 [Alphaproteobacteria bacterium]